MKYVAIKSLKGDNKGDTVFTAETLQNLSSPSVVRPAEPTNQEETKNQETYEEEQVETIIEDIGDDNDDVYIY